MRIVFLSYDGALDPLGGSQIIPYLEGLSTLGVETTLISFEKPARNRGSGRDRMRADLRAKRIRWRPLRYHSAPRLAATLVDMLAGVAMLRRESLRRPPDIVHCRGDVAMAMARWASLSSRSQLLYDIRGFFADERVESGSWNPGGALDRLVRRIEAANLKRADGLVALTQAALVALSERRNPLPSHRIIPTCVDTTLFHPAAHEAPATYSLVYGGALGSWYRGQEMMDFTRAAVPVLGAPALILTQQTQEAERLSPGNQFVNIHSGNRQDVPGWLRRCQAAFFFYDKTPARRATCPTKLGEALATGLPVLCNRGIGDLDAFIEAEGVGVLIDRFDVAAYREGATRLLALLRTPGLSDRCRRAAEKSFGLGGGVAAYYGLYRELVGHQRDC